MERCQALLYHHELQAKASAYRAINDADVAERSPLQAAVSALQSQDEISLKPHLGASLSIVAASAHAEPDASPCAGESDAAPTAPHALSAPWILPSGTVHWPTLRGLAWQVLCTLSTYPGITEELLAARLDHAVGRAHLVMLLKRMETVGAVRCVSMPMHVGCVTGGVELGRDGETPDVHPVDDLVATAAGLVPSIFAGEEGDAGVGGETLRLLPLVSHYFCEVGMSLDAEMEKYGKKAWI